MTIRNITTAVEPSPLIPTTKWEKGAQIVVVSRDGVEVERLLMFPAKGETLASLLDAHGYTS